MFTYEPIGTCSTKIELDITPDKHIRFVRFTDGCDGNLSAVSRLVEGMSVEDAVQRLSGIDCQNGTSCPDQLAKALKEYMKMIEK